MSSPVSSPFVPAVLELKACRPALAVFGAWIVLLSAAILCSTLPAAPAAILAVLTGVVGLFALSTQLFGRCPWALVRAEWTGEERWLLTDARGVSRVARFSPASRFGGGWAVLRWIGGGPCGWAFVAESAVNRELLRRLRVRLSIS